MQLNVASRAPGGPARPTSGLWLAAAAEISVAVAVGVLVLAGRADGAGPPAAHHPVQMHWSAALFGSAALAIFAMIWWAVTRAWPPAVLAALGLLGAVSSAPVRTLALHSHLVAMAALEILLVAVPLLLFAAARHAKVPPLPGRSSTWTLALVAVAALYGLLFVLVHLPAVHRSSSGMSTVPLWAVALAGVIGVAYWVAILSSAGRVTLAVRRTALLLSQEVAAIIALATLLFSTTADQLLGAALMLITCAAVTLPLLRRFDKQAAAQHLRLESHVR
jgi:hypothetical protein